MTDLWLACACAGVSHELRINPVTLKAKSGVCDCPDPFAFSELVEPVRIDRDINKLTCYFSCFKSSSKS